MYKDTIDFNLIFLTFLDLALLVLLLKILHLLWRWIVLQLWNDVELTVLGQVETVGILLLGLGFYLGLQLDNFVVLKMEDEELVNIKHLHLIQKILLDELAILLDDRKVQSSHRLKFN